MAAENPATIPLPPVDDLTEPQQGVVALYEEVFSLPVTSPQDQDNRTAELEAADVLADELLHDLVLSGMLRQTAFERVRQAKEAQEAPRKGNDDIGFQVGGEPAMNGALAKPPKQPKLPMLESTRVLRTLERAGIEVDPGGGKGNHVKVYNPETGKTTTLHGGEIDPITLKKFLGQIGIPPDDFLSHM